jgi:hypothetical protein
MARHDNLTIPCRKGRPTVSLATEQYGVETAMAGNVSCRRLTVPSSAAAGLRSITQSENSGPQGTGGTSTNKRRYTRNR